MAEANFLTSVALNSPPQDLLCEAIKRGNTTAAKALIAQFPDVLHAVDTADGATADAERRRQNAPQKGSTIRATARKNQNSAEKNRRGARRADPRRAQKRSDTVREG